MEVDKEAIIEENSKRMRKVNSATEEPPELLCEGCGEVECTCKKIWVDEDGTVHSVLGINKTLGLLRAKKSC